MFKISNLATFVGFPLIYSPSEMQRSDTGQIAIRLVIIIQSQSKLKVMDRINRYKNPVTLIHMMNHEKNMRK